MRREIKKWQEFIRRVRRVDLPLSWKMSWLALLLAAVLTLTWLPQVSHSNHAKTARKAVQCATINRLTSAEFIAQFDRALATHWQATPRAVQWARQYRLGSRLTATLTPQRTAVNLVGDSYGHLTRVIETWTALLVQESEHVLVVPGDIDIERLQYLLLDKVTACEYPIVIVKNTPEHALTEQARDMFEALLDDSLAELRVGEQIVHPQRMLVIFLTTLTSAECAQLTSEEQVSALHEDTTQPLSNAQYATDVLRQTRNVHATLTARQWSHRFLQRIRHTVLLLNM